MSAYERHFSNHVLGMRNAIYGPTVTYGTYLHVKQHILLRSSVPGNHHSTVGPE